MVELLTSLDVVNQSFKKSLRGYDAAEVDEFLDHVAETLQTYAQKTKDLERELAVMGENLAEYEKMKDVLHEALLMAQKSADDKIKGANDQAEKIICDAKNKADSICSDAVQEAERLREGVLQIRNVRNLYEQEFRGLLAKFDNMLNQSVALSSLAGAVDSILEDSEVQDEPKKTENNNSSASSGRKDLESAYTMLGIDPKDILDSNSKNNEGNKA